MASVWQVARLRMLSYRKDNAVVYQKVAYWSGTRVQI
jgi:hypothetical protein